MGKTRGGLLSTKTIVSCLKFTKHHPKQEVKIFVFNVLLLSLSSISQCKIDTNDALHYYKSENAITTNGVLNITTNLKDNEYKAFNEKTKKYYADTKHVQSAMIQGWNKFCMTGGIIEYSAKLPGKGSIGGLWPACKFRV